MTLMAPLAFNQIAQLEKSMGSTSKRLSALLSAGVIAASVLLAVLPGTALSADVTTAAAPATAAALSVSAPSRDVVDNPYGLDALWKGGDFVAKGTLLMLMFMSMGSWYIMIVKLLEQRKLAAQARHAESVFWSGSSIADGIIAVEPGSPFRMIAESGYKAVGHHEGKLLQRIDLNTWIAMSINRSVGKVQSRLQNGLTFLATVGSTAPFVGLFGTVWGIYHALTAIGIAGQASIDKVAGPVGEALIMTAIGLAVAVPAVLGYNWLVRRNKVGMEQVRAFGEELHMVLLSGSETDPGKRG